MVFRNRTPGQRGCHDQRVETADHLVESCQTDRIRVAPCEHGSRCGLFGSETLEIRQDHREIDRRGRRTLEKPLQVIIQRHYQWRMEFVRFSFGVERSQLPRILMAARTCDEKRWIGEPTGHPIKSPSIQLGSRDQRPAKGPRHCGHERRDEPTVVRTDHGLRRLQGMAPSTGASGVLERGAPRDVFQQSGRCGDVRPIPLVTAVFQDVSVGSERLHQALGGALVEERDFRAFVGDVLPQLSRPRVRPRCDPCKGRKSAMPDRIPDARGAGPGNR
jgi:hypothetical protein